MHEDEVRVQDMTFSVCAILYGEAPLIMLGLTNQWLFSQKGLTRSIMHGISVQARSWRLSLLNLGRNIFLVPIFRGCFQFGPCVLKAFNWVSVFLSRYQFYPWSQLR